MIIRKAKIKDIDGIDNIYNQAISEKFCVADLTPWTKEKRFEWFNEHNNEYPIFVMEIDNVVAGYIYISPYRPGRMALKHTAEVSYYVDKNYRKKGIGKQLNEHMETECKKMGIKTIFAIVIDNNIASINLLKKRGYER